MPDSEVPNEETFLEFFFAESTQLCELGRFRMVLGWFVIFIFENSGGRIVELPQYHPTVFFSISAWRKVHKCLSFAYPNVREPYYRHFLKVC